MHARIDARKEPTTLIWISPEVLDEDAHAESSTAVAVWN